MKKITVCTKCRKIITYKNYRAKLKKFKKKGWRKINGKNYCSSCKKI